MPIASDAVELATLDISGVTSLRSFPPCEGSAPAVRLPKIPPRPKPIAALNRDCSAPFPVARDPRPVPTPPARAVDQIGLMPNRAVPTPGARTDAAIPAAAGMASRRVKASGRPVAGLRVICPRFSKALISGFDIWTSSVSPIRPFMAIMLESPLYGAFLSTIIGMFVT